MIWHKYKLLILLLFFKTLSPLYQQYWSEVFMCLGITLGGIFIFFPLLPLRLLKKQMNALTTAFDRISIHIRVPFACPHILVGMWLETGVAVMTGNSKQWANCKHTHTSFFFSISLHSFPSPPSVSSVLSLSLPSSLFSTVSFSNSWNPTLVCLRGHHGDEATAIFRLWSSDSTYSIHRALDCFHSSTYTPRVCWFLTF